MSEEQNKESTKAKKKRRVFQYQSFETSAIQRKLGIAVFLMSMLPILLMLYIVFYHTQNSIVDTTSLVDHTKVNIKGLVALSVCGAILGYWIIRKTSREYNSFKNV